MLKDQRRFLILRGQGGRGTLCLPLNEPLEFPSAWLDRAANTIGGDRKGLVNWLAAGRCDNLLGDFDKEPQQLALYVGWNTLEPEQAPHFSPLKGPWRLHIDKRLSYCPLCMSQDLRRGRIPFFRAEWTWAWITHCTWHSTPLFRWDIVADTNTGERSLPRSWIAKALGTKADTLRGAELQRTKRLQGPLRVAREARWWPGDQSPFAWFWREQVCFERELQMVRMGSGSSELLGAFGGRRTFLRTVDDLAGIFMTNFAHCVREPWAGKWQGYLGPETLYGGFGRIPPYRGAVEPGLMCKLGDPKLRRTIIALVYRVLMGFRNDLYCSGRGGTVEPGCNAMTNDLKALPEAGKFWCSYSWDSWSEVVRRGFERSL